jgi:hypothetical protein
MDALQGLTYCDRLSKLNLQTLELIRLVADVVSVFKINKCLVNVDKNISEIAQVSTLRGQSLKLLKTLCVIQCCKSSFSCRVIDVWNCLPEFVVDLNSVC